MANLISRRAVLIDGARTVALVVAFPSVLAACSSPGASGSASPVASSASIAPIASAAASPSASGLDMAAIEAAARQEGTVAWYTFATDAPLVDLFKAKYPWANVELTEFPTVGQIKAKFLLESRGGVNVADLVTGFGADMGVYLGENLLAPAELPNDSITLPLVYDPGHYQHPLNLVLVVYGISPTAGTQPPRDLFELADPVWKGKLAFDNPSNGAIGATFLASRRSMWGDDKWRQWLAGLAANEALLTGSTGAAYDAVLQGQRAVGICNYSPIHLQKPGTPVAAAYYDQLLVSPTYMGVHAKAPHPNMALLFANWMVGPEGQAWYASQGRVPSADIDTPLSLSKIVPSGETTLDLASLEGWFADPDAYLEIYREYWPN